ncbi:glycerophosphodiester phosphodiesterase family protein [Brucella sp. BE17]|uniref:glycerophosphodiester phosphodiesterase n=1 Tax=Brucella sp. BE17 TaxID=3142977 RepID=UPI0031B9EDAD
MTLIIAHRGYSALWPENSFQSWSAAIEAGADAIEIDIRFSEDGIAHCSHDASLERLSGQKLRINEIISADILSVTINGEPVAPTFASALALVPDQITLLLDIKDESEAALSHLDKIVKKVTDVDIVLGLHAQDSVSYLAALGHDRILGFIPCADEAEEFVTRGATLIRLWEIDATPERMAKLTAMNIPVWISTGETGDEGRICGDYISGMLHEFRDAGAGGLLVNDPVKARRELAASVSGGRER